MRMTDLSAESFISRFPYGYVSGKFVSDRDGQVSGCIFICVNHNFEIMSGVGADELTGRDISAISRDITEEQNTPELSIALAVADAFDAMTSDRTYRKAITREKALKELCDNSGTQFDPQMVDLFSEVLHEEQQMDR